MSDEFENYEEDYDDTPYYLQVYTVIGPKVKQFLADYFGDKMNNLEAETYLKLENAIRDGFKYTEVIPDMMYFNRSISSDDFYKLEETYVFTNKKYIWPNIEYTYDIDDDEDDEDEQHDNFLEDTDPIDLTEEQRQAKKLMESADKILDFNAALSAFCKAGYKVLNPALHEFFETTASLDLELLTPAGFKEVQENIAMVISEMLENVFDIIDADLEM